MLDALGFKGIWKRAGGAQQVLAKMKSLSQHASEVHRLGKRPGAPLNFKCRCISDTVVIGIWPSDEAATADREQTLQASIILAKSLVSELCKVAVDGDLALAYRGAIAVGQFEMEGGFIVGPAVDEAASLMELAEGALVWLAPSAIDAESRDHAGVGSLRHTIPLKGGARYRSSVVLPWADTLHFHEKVRVARAILRTFRTKTPDLSISIKRQRTAWFLNKALKDAFARLPDKNVSYDAKPAYAEAPKLR